MEKMYSTLSKLISVNQLKNPVTVLAIAILFSMSTATNKLLADGSPQFRPDTTKATNLMIINNQTQYGTFAGYSAADTNRLYIRINNPANERIYFGIGQRSTSTNWYVRIKNPNGVVIFGPQLLPTSAGQGFIQNHKQAIAGPNVVNPQGYNGFNVNPTSGLAGDYYIEFNQGSGTTVANNTELNLGIFDVTVVNTVLNTALTGRLFSKNWSFNTESYANPFYGFFYIYGKDSSVTKVDMNGIKPYKFRVSCNAFGTANTGNATNDRRSKLGFSVLADLKLFLSDPDVITYPSGSMQFLNGPPTFSRCVKDSLCINVDLTNKSDVTVIIDRNNNNKFDPGTADRKLFFPQVNPGQTCLYWDGKDGFGNLIGVGNLISVILSVESGLVNLPMYDVENHENGFSMSVIRPGSALFVDSLFYDDVLVGGTTNLTGCAFPCHTWVSNPPNTDQNTIGESNTMNTWWFAHKLSQKTFISLPDYLINDAGTDQSVCTKGGNQDTVQLSGSIAYTQSAYTGSVQWTTSGTGQFIPNDSTKNGKYVPSAADIASGSVMLILSPRYVCTNAKDTLIVNFRKSPILTATPLNVNCFGQATGSINLSVSNSIAPHTFSWSNGSSAQNLANVIAGTYTVTVTSSQSCSTSATTTITQPAAALALSATPTAVNCYGQSTGSISLVVAGGTGPYTYNWSNGASTQNLTNVPAGNYTVTVTDAKSCTAAQTSISVTQPSAALNISYTKVNVACNGNATGSINLTVTGGTAPYTYNWSNGATTSNISGLTAGNYTVTVTDSKSCTSVSASINISQPSAALATTATPTNVNCFGGATGSIAVTVSGGTTPYTYAWNTGATSQNLSGIVAGTYTLTVTDANGCTSSQASVQVTQPSAALSSSVSATHVNCFGGATGSIALTVNGGTSPYSYLWNTGATSQNLSGIVAGTYTVTVTDAKGCTSSQSSIQITQPSAALTTSASAIAVNCFGGSTGAITVIVSGGTTPYTYVWNSGATTQNLSGVTAGNYTVTVTDGNGCTASQASVSITQPSAALTSSASATNVNCFGVSTGAINLTVSGGTSPYSYLWNTGATSQNLTGIAAGTYTVTVTDAKGCTSSQSSINVTQPAASLSVSASAMPVNCFGGSTGSINLTVNGGTAPYTFAWSTGASSQNITGITAGSYSVTVTDSKGCTTTQASISITQPIAALSASASATHVNCFGGSTGSISLTVAGGTTPYSYQWNTGATTQNLSAIAAGNYTVTVTDANGCTSLQASIGVTQPAAALSSSVGSSQNVNCFGATTGSINLTVSGGTLPYSFNWSHGATTQNLSGIGAGTYSVTVTDAKGCVSTTNSITISQPSAGLSASIASTQNVSCNGGGNGALVLTVNGGTSPYTYVWSNGATTQNINGLNSGIYNVTITDANGCTHQATGTVSQPSNALSATISSSQNVFCFGGTNAFIQLAVSGGTAPYAYNWSNGATSQNLSNIGAGSYSVTITDANNCIYAISKTITQPSGALSAVVSVSQNVSCFDAGNGSVTLVVTGGTAPFTYLWSNGAVTQNISNLTAGTYSVTVTDANGCSTNASHTITQPSAALSATISSTQNVSCFGLLNGSVALAVSGGTTPYTYLWSTGAIAQNLSGIGAGTYSVTVTDANGCTALKAAVISQPAASLSATISSSQNVLCHNGNNASIQLNVAGGTAPYAFNWSNGATTQNINNLVAGTYSATITDANGCTTQISKTITQPAQSLSASVTSSQQISCYGLSNGTINVAVTGGTSPYTYNWSNGATSQNLTGVGAGTYSVTVTDGNGCSSNLNALTLSQPAAPLSSSISVTDVGCYGQSTASIMLSVSGGTTPYAYNWSNGATSQNLTNISSGSYSVTITDANGCTSVQQSIAVDQPAAALAATVSASQNVSCFGGSNGSISLTVNGGTAPYSFSWSNGATTQNLSSINAGTYSVTITDAHNCTKQVAGIVVSQPAGALATTITSGQNVSCNGGGNGSLNLVVTGGTTPYSYNWSNGATTQNIAGLYAGTYNVSVSDANGCTTAATGTVSQPSGALSSSVSASQNILCYGGNNGSVTLAIAGGTAPYAFQWNTGATTQNLSNLAAGNYAVTVTDANSCISQSSVVISQPTGALSATLNASQNVLCYGQSTGSIDVIVTGGTAPFVYAWSNGATTQDLTNIGAGSYTLSITDANNCTYQLNSVVISQPGAALSSSTQITSVNCFSGNTGAINLTVTGGTTPYTYNWSNGANTQNISGIAAGSYSVTITDANGCSVANNALTVSQPAAALTLSIGTTEVNCFGQNTGAITTNVSGGTQPYSYNWSNGVTTANLTAIISGTYSLTVTDANGCNASTGAVTIAQPAAALSLSHTATSAGCFGVNTGGIDLTVVGGTQPYNYMWTNGATSEDLTGVASGNYTVTVTDANGCTAISSAINVGQPSGALNAAVINSQNINCFGNATGAITLSVSGGTTPYQYNWSNGATSSSLTSISAGTYSVTITDANGCSAYLSSIAITQPGASLSTSIATLQNVNCYGQNTGSILINATGGTTPYSYNWSNGAITQNITGLSAGIYSVTVTDANNCTSTLAGISISEPLATLYASVSASQNVSCTGGGNGAIDVTTNGGTQPYLFNWSNGSTSENLSGLSSGTYALTITDANGCLFNLSQTILQPASALSTAIQSMQNINCFGNSTGAITLAVSGGTTPYTYAWSNGATSQNISGLADGIYTVTITDANGCFENQSATLTQPAAALAASVNALQNVGCFGQNTGLIDVTVVGGTMPYFYAWNNGATTSTLTGIAAGTYAVTITDANNCATSIGAIAINQPGGALQASVSSTQNVACTGGGTGAIDVTVSSGTAPYTFNWSNGATTEDIGGLSTGAYTLTITDANGCTFTLVETVSQPASNLATSIQSTQNVDCYGNGTGSIDLSASGGTGPYVFLWNTGATTEDISNLTIGTYTVTVTDANGCYNNQSATITQPSAALDATASGVQQILCFGNNTGSITLSVNGGTLPYTFNWSNGAVTQDLTGIGAGTYAVSVTDANGCSTSESVTLSQPVAALTTSITSTQAVLCYGGTTGGANLDILGGTAPYTIQWSNGSSTQNQTALSAGNYSVAVTDANGCTSSQTATITEPQEALSGGVSAVDSAGCFGASSGSIDITVTGGTLPYVYNWSNGSASEDLQNIPAGNYSVSVTDGNGCGLALSAVVGQPASALSSSISVGQNVSCFSGNNAVVNLVVTGGTAPYTYNWSNGANTQSISGLGAGTYTVTVTDANNCIIIDSIAVTQPSGALSASYVMASAVWCYGGSNGAVDVTVTGGTLPYFYQWSNGEVTEDLSNISAGNYTLTVTDANGCLTNLLASVTQPNGPLTPTVAITPVGCFADTSGMINLTVTGGTQPYYFYWSNGATTQNLYNLSGGGYWVTIVDSNNCVAQGSAYIPSPEGAVQAYPVVTHLNCTSITSGSILLNPTGGTPGYTFLWSNGATTENLLNITAGQYTVTISDSAGCTFTTSMTVNGPSTPLSLAGQHQDINCHGNNTGSINVTASGGIPPYSYAWTNGYTTASITNLAAGLYKVIVTDAYNCSVDTVFQIIQPDSGLANIVSATNINCYGQNNGSINVTTVGGSPAYVYQWNNGATTSSIQNLSPGTYQLTVTDANGCFDEQTITITQPAALLDASSTANESNCLNGIGADINVTISGGTAPYQYAWSNGSSYQDLTNIGAGTYSLTVTDANGCITQLTQIVNDVSVFSMSADGPTEFCVGGLVTLNALVVQGANYQWYQNGQVLTGATQPSFTTPAPGTYMVSLTNACGNFMSNPIEVKVNSVGNYSVSPNTMICPNEGESAQLNAYGGSWYMWNPGTGLSDSTIAAPIAAPKTTTKYVVTITSNEGCKVSAEVLVSVICDTLFVPTGFSPDGNTVNDIFQIDGLSKYPGNNLFIYNRWGNLVYKRKDYDNTWDGTSNVAGVYLGKQLPNGTYYYILDLNDGKKPMQGYLTLKR